jgi:hypothetical protein
LIGRARICFRAPRQFIFPLHQYLPERITTISQDSRGKRHARLVNGAGEELELRHEMFNAIDAKDSLPFYVIDYLLGQPQSAGYASWTNVALEAVHGRPCYRLSEAVKGYTHLVWVDAKSYLIVKARETYDLRFERDEVYLFHPQ